MPYKLGSLFDGSGGFPLSGSLCGIEPRWAAEVEPYPIAVTRTRFPNMRHLGDISKVNGADIEPVDIITFGSPCQDLSVAGKRAGLKHEANGDEETTRSGLFMEAVRIIKEMREATNGIYPRFALWENVPGAFSSNKGEDFRIVCEELIKVVEPSAIMPEVPQKGWAYADSYIGDGWSLAYRVFDAQYWGVPQRRRRIHLVVDFRGTSAREVLFEREGVRGYFETGRTPWQTAPADAQNCPAADDREGEGFDGYNGDLTGEVAATLGVNCGVSTGRNGVIERGRLDAVAYTLKMRAGCEGGGKGALVQTDKSATLATNNDQYLFQPVTLEPGIAAREGGHIYEGVSGTLRANAGDNKMAVAYAADQITDANILDDQGGQQVSVRTDGKAPTLRAEMHGNIPSVLTPVFAIDQQGGKGGANYAVDVMPTMCSDSHGTPHAVAYLASGKETVGTLMASASAKMWLGNQEAQSGDYHIIEKHPVVIDRAFFNQGQNAKYDPQFYTDGTVPTLIARGPAAVQVRYIVRRLTPTECARLQGFADRWGDIEKKDSFTPEEYEFWLNVRNTHAAINGKKVQDYTETQMVTWYNKLQSDANEYKMWGNGIALPPALYCMQGIIGALNKEEDDDAWLS